MALIWVLGGTEMLFWNFDRDDLSPGWRWVEIIETWRDINVSHPSRSQLNSMQVSIYMSLTSIQVTSHLHAAPENCISCPSRSNLKPIQLSLRVSYFHSCPASPASMPPPPPPPPPTPQPPLHAPFHIHPCPKIIQFMLQPGHDVGISHPSISCLTSIQVKRIAPQLHPSSTATNPGLKMCVSTQSRPHRTAKTQYLHSISTQD